MAQDKPRPSEIRALILAQHEELRRAYTEVEALLSSTRTADEGGVHSLRARCRDLYQLLLRHIATEDEFLAPALRETDGFGPQRAEDLLQEHERQRRLLRYALASIDESTADTTLMQSIPSLLALLRADMEHEEKDLLSPELLRDDSVEIDVCTG